MPTTTSHSNGSHRAHETARRASAGTKSARKAPAAKPARDAQAARKPTAAVRGAKAATTPVRSEAPESEGVGARLRFLRESHGLSQRELARRAGLNHGTVGSIEKETISPSVGSLRKILDSFPMTLSEFFALDPASETQVFFRGEELMEVGGGGISLRQVGRNLKGRPLQVLLERYRPGAETAPQPYSHSGDEGGVVIQGTIEITVGGATRVLGPGDGYLFSSRLPHVFRNVGDGEAVVVSANTPPV